MSPDDDAARLLSALAGPTRAMVLTELQYWLSLTMRATYRAPEAGRGDLTARIQCANELLLIVINELRQESGLIGAGYPDRAFVMALRERAELSGCSGLLEDAVERALKRA